MFAAEDSKTTDHDINIEDLFHTGANHYCLVAPKNIDAALDELCKRIFSEDLPC